MKKFALAVAVMALALGGTAKAAMFDYAKLYGGVTIEPQLSWDDGFGALNYDMDSGFNVGGALGWNVSHDLSVEVDGMFTHSQYSCCTSTLETFSIMVDGIYHIDIGSKWTPYVGVGIGGLQNTYSNTSGTGGASDFVFAAQGIAGMSIPISSDLDIGLEYRYQWSDDASDSGITWEYKSHNIDLGLTFHL